MDRRKFILGTGTAIAAVGLAGCGSPSGDETTEPSDDEDSDDDFDPFSIEGETDGEFDNVELVSHDIAQTGDDVGVTGVVENTSDKVLDYVEVEVSLNDGDTIIGEFVDTSDEELDFLAPGNRWRFHVSFEDEDLSRARGYTIGIESEVDDEIDTGLWDGNETG